MPRVVATLLFVALFFSIVLGSHAYVAWRLMVQTALPRPWAILGCSLFALGACLAPIGMIFSRKLPMHLARPLLAVIFTWLGTFFFLLVLTAAVDVALIVWGWWQAYATSNTLAPADPSRRLAMVRALRAGQVAVAGAVAWHSHHTAKAGPCVVRVPVALARFPSELDGLTIAQISDLHVAPLLGRDYVAGVVRKVMAQSPDVIVITGDLVDGSVADLRDSIAPLAGLSARHGVYFITGNHEYYSGADAWLEHVQSLGIRPLRNERVSIGAGAQSFDLAGIDDWTAHNFGPGHGADLPRALAGRDAARELVLLAHQPKAIHEAQSLGVGLMLSGHTHGGQMWPFGFLVRLAQPYVSGLHKTGATQIYVNRGTGYWGPPMRLGATPEITLLTLRRGTPD